MNDKINILNLRIFKATDAPEEAKAFRDGHHKVLASQNITGLNSSDSSWLENPNVYLMALYSGKKIVAGSRLQTYHPEHEYPFMAALKEKDASLLPVMDISAGEYQAEWCGLWVSAWCAGWGLGEVLTRVAIATSHAIGLDYIYGICPRHTLDLFRSVGFHFITLEEKIIQFPYPTSEFMSYVIQCEVKKIEYAFKSEVNTLNSWFENPEIQILSKGKGGECFVQFNGFPAIDDTLIKKAGKRIKSRENHKKNTDRPVI